MTPVSTMQHWSYAPSLGSARLCALASAPSFRAILDIINESAEVLCAHKRDCEDIDGFSRVVATLVVPSEVFDLFFNSEHGYRGAYVKSPYAGLEANDIALDRLVPLVLKHNDEKQCGIDPIFLAESLGSPSAKIWLAEVGLELCPLCTGEWSKPTDPTPEVFNGLWDPTTGVEATWGCKAPYLTKLKLVGAFLTDRYDEYVPFHKRRRAELIHRRGWA